MNSTTPWRVFIRRFAVLGLTGFGGPPAHLSQLRRTWVDSKEIPAEEFQDALAATTLLPGPTSTQMSIWVGWRVRGIRGASLAALLFISPALIFVTTLAVALKTNPLLGPWILKGAVGATWIMPAVVLHAGWSLVPDALRPTTWRLTLTQIQFLVIVTLAAGLEQVQVLSPIVILLLAGIFTVVTKGADKAAGSFGLFVSSGITNSLTSLALKIGLLSVGGGLVVIPIMHSDAVTIHHWVSEETFIVLVALGQLTPGPVFSTVAALGYYVDGLRGVVLASLVVFTPSYLIVIWGAPQIQRLRKNPNIQHFFAGALPASIGLILGTAPIFLLGIRQGIGLIACLISGVLLFMKRLPLSLALLSGVALGLIVAHPK